MRSERKGFLRHSESKWNKNVNPFPIALPVVTNYEDTYSNDLITSNPSSGYTKWGRKRFDRGTGGDFEVLKRTYRESKTQTPGALILEGQNGPETRVVLSQGQRGTVAAITNDQFPVPARSSTSELRALGRKAISRTVPTESEVDLSTTLGEILMEGLPSMIGLAGHGRDRGAADRAASENLNYEFGVKPFVNDVQDAVRAFRNSKELWDRYVANAGKVLRRRYDFPSEIKVTRSVGTSNPQPYGDRLCYSGASHPREIVETTIKRQWFVAHYRYAIPDDPFQRNLSRWNKLYGALPDVETLWNITPWSWALDWVGDLGTSISNIAAFQADGLVMLHGAMMEYTSTKREVYLGPVTYVNRGNNPGPSYFTQVFHAERKRRVVATPYGFDLTWDDFTPRQVGILASLGITRKRNVN